MTIFLSLKYSLICGIILFIFFGDTKNTKLKTEQAIVCQRQRLSANTEIKYKGGWDNYMRNSIGTYDIIDHFGNISHRDYGNWHDNKKHGCFNEIVYEIIGFLKDVASVNTFAMK